MFRTLIVPALLLALAPFADAGPFRHRGCSSSGAAAACAPAAAAPCATATASCSGSRGGLFRHRR